MILPGGAGTVARYLGYSNGSPLAHFAGYNHGMSRPITADDLLKFISVGSPQFQPKTGNILFSRGHTDEKRKGVRNLWMATEGGSEPFPFATAPGGNGPGKFCPCGSKLAFVSGRDKPSSQIYVMPTSGGEAVALTHFPEGSILEFKWSPNGEQIAVLFIEKLKEFTAAAEEDRKNNGGATPPIEIDDIWYRLDGSGYFGNNRAALYLVNASTGEHHQLYAGDRTGNMGFDWLPDSSALIVCHSANEYPMVDRPNDQFYRVAITGEVTQIPGLKPARRSNPTVSPNGQLLAYTGNPDIHDVWGTGNEQLFIVNLKSGTEVSLTDETDFCLGVGTLSDSKEASFSSSLFWLPDSSGLVTQIGWHGSVKVATIKLNKSVHFHTADGVVTELSDLSADGTRAAVVVSSPVALAELAVLELSTGKLSPITHFNTDLQSELHIHAPEEIWVDSTDGAKVQTWVLKPEGSGPFPAVVEVHGGPHAQYGWTFFHEFQTLVAAGYVVVYSNPRGSKGYGQGWCSAIRGNWGDKDWDDVLAVSKFAAQLPYVDSTRVGIMGGSYGGYMTNWAIGPSKMYKAAITDRCVSNLVSMAGSSDFPINADDYFGGKAWGDLDAIKDLWHQSPIAYFDGVSTPTLIIHSEGDLRCNIEQGEQVFHALQMQKVPSRFVRYPKETSHGMSRSGPADLRIHRLNEICNWWKKYL